MVDSISIDRKFDVVMALNSSIDFFTNAIDITFMLDKEVKYEVGNDYFHHML